MLAAQTVECSNCGSDPLWTVIGIVVAGAALVASLVALKFSADAVTIAKKQLRIDQEQFEVFMRQMNARAEFDLELSFPDADAQSRIETDTPATNVRLAIKLTNSGGKRAGPTVLNVIIPNRVTEAYWTDAGGGLIPGLGAMSPAPTLERLTDDSGTPWSCKFLSLELPHVSTRSPVLKFVTVMVHLPTPDAVSVPFRATAEADELDGEEESARTMLYLVPKGEG